MKRCAWISSRKQKTFANIWMVLVFWVYARVYLAIIKEMEFQLVPFLIFESSYIECLMFVIPIMSYFFTPRYRDGKLTKSIRYCKE